jgi:hypothetical protein
MHLARPVRSRFKFYHRHYDKSADAELSMARARYPNSSYQAFCKSTRCSDIVHCSRFDTNYKLKSSTPNYLPDQTQQRKNEIRCAVGALTSPVQKLGRSIYQRLVCRGTLSYHFKSVLIQNLGLDVYYWLVGSAGSSCKFGSALSTYSTSARSRLTL